MFNELMRLASEAGTYAAEAQDFNIGETATNTPLRRISNNGYLDGRIHSPMSTDNQLDAFRGVAYAAIDKIARRVAQVPLRLCQYEHSLVEDEATKVRVNFHPFMTLFNDGNGHRPHEEYSVWEMKYVLQASLDTTGESWWYIERDKLGVPSRITPLPSNRMTIVFDKDTGLVSGHFYCPKGTTPEMGGIFIPKLSFPELQKPQNWTKPFLVFIRYPSPRGIEDPRGWSPIKAAAYAYDINLYEQIYKKNFLQQGGQLGGILQSEVALNKDQIEEYIEQFKIRHSGPRHAGLPMVLPKMLKWTTTEPTPRDMQWAEAINLTASQILQIYGISDAKLGRADIGNRNTADAMDVTFNREVIQSRLDIVEAKLNTEFLPIYPRQTDALYFSAEFDDPVPSDGEAQLKREDQDLKNGIRTPNEIRKDRNMSPFGKYGDQVYKALNMIPIDPMAATLEISQDDMDKLGFVNPKEQAEIDALANPDAGKTQDAGKKQDGEVDPKASKNGKDNSK